MVFKRVSSGLGLRLLASGIFSDVLQIEVGPRVHVPLVGGPVFRSSLKWRGVKAWSLSLTVLMLVSTFSPQAPGVVFVLVWARAASINFGLIGLCRVGRGGWACSSWGRAGVWGQAATFAGGPFLRVRLAHRLLSHGPCPPTVGGHIL